MLLAILSGRGLAAGGSRGFVGLGLGFPRHAVLSISLTGFYMLLWSGGTPGGSVAAPSAPFTSNSVPTP